VNELLIGQRFRGPARSGNGGYTAGLVAAAVGTTGVEVSLRKPPPLDTPLLLATDGAATHLLDGDDLVADAVAVEELPEAVAAVGFDEAESASAAFPGYTFHPFPTCFACGTDRPDGLRIFPGPVEDLDGATRVAAPWIAPEYVDLPTTWAALDCSGGWAGDLTERLMVLGRMTATIDSLPEPGERCVVMGLDRGTEGRRTNSLATVYGADGRLIGRAKHVWVAVDPARFN